MVGAAHAEQGATALSRAEIRAIPKRLSAEHLRQLYAISRVLNSSDDTESALREVLAVLDQTLPIHSAMLLIRDRPSIRIACRSEPGAVPMSVAKALAESSFDYLVEGGRGRHEHLEAFSEATPPVASGPAEAHQLISLPLVAEPRMSFGLLQLQGVKSFKEADLSFISALTMDVASALDRRLKSEEERVAAESALARAEERRLGAEAKQAQAELVEQQARADRLRASFGKAAAELAQAQAERRSQNVEAARERFEAIVGCTDQGFIWEADEASLRISYVSVAVAPILGFPREQWVGAPGFFLQRVHPDDRSAVAQMLRDVPASCFARCEHRFVTAGGQVVWFQTRVHKSPRTASTAVSLQGISSSIEHERAHEPVAMGAVSEKDRPRPDATLGDAGSAPHTRDDLLATVSHDLRTPLNVILLTLGVMETAPAGTNNASDLERVRRSAERMNRLLRDVLDSAQVEADSLILDLELLSVGRLLEEAHENLLPMAQNKGVQLKSTVIGQIPSMSADARRVQQVFAHLVGNAIKFTPSGGSVVLRAERAGEYVQFAVRDTGPGIPQSELAHVFERFWQARRTAQLGSGLGLYIAQGIVLAHGGRLWVESSIGVGSTFYFSLPIAQTG